MVVSHDHHRYEVYRYRIRVFSNENEIVKNYESWVYSIKKKTVKLMSEVIIMMSNVNY